MSLREKLTTEIKALVLTTLFFAAWFLVLVALKELILEEYQIQFRGWSLALVGALVVAKVVLVLEHVSLGQWIHKHPAVLDVILRTLLYTLGVAVALWLEKAFELRHEFGGFRPALAQVFHHRDMPHIWANVICAGCALLVFNALTVVRRHVGEKELARIFIAAPPAQTRG